MRGLLKRSEGGLHVVWVIVREDQGVQFDLGRVDGIEDLLAGRFPEGVPMAGVNVEQVIVGAPTVRRVRRHFGVPRPRRMTLTFARKPSVALAGSLTSAR